MCNTLTFLQKAVNGALENEEHYILIICASYKKGNNLLIMDSCVPHKNVGVKI